MFAARLRREQQQGGMPPSQPQTLRDFGFLPPAVGVDLPLLAWSGEKMDTQFFLLHFLVEFLGSAFFLFMQCQVVSSPDPSRDSAAFWPALAAFGAVRYIRPSATLNPFETLFADVFIFRLHTSWLGVFKILGTIGFQVSGAVFGSWLAYFFQGSEPLVFAANLTMPYPGVPSTEYQLMLGDLLWSFGIGIVAFSYIHQTVKDYKEKNGRRGGVDQDADAPGELQALPKIEGAAVAAVLFAAIAAMYYTTRGSFVITRSLGPAFVLGAYTNIGWFLLGQSCGYLAAVIVVVFALFEH
jgi:hypothetical protein